jgi:hypothetical protein
MPAKDQFTPDAAILWSSFPETVKPKILKNVYCANCRATVEIVDFKGTAVNGDLVLEGSCNKCGGKVARLLETSQLKQNRN